METTRRYQISSKVSGAILGVYEGATPEDALDALAAEAEAGDLRDDSELAVEEVQP